jgi:DNA-binding transcriptional LysR family regulator
VTTGRGEAPAAKNAPRMKLTLEAIEVIDAIERRGTFAAAAEELNKVPSALSYVIQKLEGDMGVKVFDRSGHRVRLTVTGTVLLQHGRHVLQEVRNLERRARRSEEGWEAELRIAVDCIIPFRALVPYISAFYGETSSTHLRFSEEALDGSWEALRSGRADMVIGALGEPPCAGVRTYVIGALDIAYCVTPGHPLAKARQPLDPHEVGRYRTVVIGDTSLHRAARSQGPSEWQESLTVQSLEAKLQLQLAGLGAGYLPLCVAQPFIDLGQLVALDLATPTLRRTFFLAWNADQEGEALTWWVEHLSKSNLIEEMWQRYATPQMVC